MTVKLIGKHEKDSRANRDAYIEAMIELMDQDERYVHIDCDLEGCINVKKLRAAHGDRVFNVGIAEANGVGTAAGMAASGLIPFVHSFGAFASRRVFDQAFLSVGFSGFPVHIVGSDPGICSAFNGATHTALEDAGLYMSVPGFIVVDSADYAQTKSMVKALAASGKPSYIRLVRKGIVKVYEDGSEFEIGKGYQLRDGNDVTIVASGILVDEALKANEPLAAEGIAARIIDMPTWKPLDEEILLKAAEETGAIVTAENHTVACGLGSAVANLFAKKRPTPMEFVGVDERYGQVGPQDFLVKEYHLTGEDIAAAAKKAIERK
jgi:transketolase